MFTFVCALSWLCLYRVRCMSKLCSLTALQLHEIAFEAMQGCVVPGENKTGIMITAIPFSFAEEAAIISKRKQKKMSSISKGLIRTNTLNKNMHIKC